MEGKLVEAFDAVHMDDACAETIRQAMENKEHRTSPARPLLRAAAAACVVLLMILVLNPATAQAVEEIIEKAKSYFTRTPGTIVLKEDYVYYNDGYLELDQRLGRISSSSLTLQSPSWLKVMDGRVYFLGNAEQTDIRYFLANKEQYDITDQFSMEEPFTCIFEKDGITHYIAIGGEYDPEVGLDSIGFGEWLRRNDKTEEGLAEGNVHAGWIGGSGVRPYDPETETLALWYAKAIVEMDIPWYNTEAQEIVKNAQTE